MSRGRTLRRWGLEEGLVLAGVGLALLLVLVLGLGLGLGATTTKKAEMPKTGS